MLPTTTSLASLLNHRVRVSFDRIGHNFVGVAMQVATATEQIAVVTQEDPDLPLSTRTYWVCREEITEVLYELEDAARHAPISD